jgi:hypothetical protein
MPIICVRMAAIVLADADRCQTLFDRREETSPAGRWPRGAPWFLGDPKLSIHG